MKKINVFYPTHPHEKQKEVLHALDNGERFVLLRAGRKFRKTSLIVSWLMEQALLKGLQAPYIAPNKTQGKNIVWDDHVQRLLDHFKAQGLPFKPNELELSIEFPNGGKFQIYGVENKEALRGISNWCAVGCDEYDDWSEDIYPLIIRPNLSTHNAPCIIAGTPKGFRNLYHLENGGIFKSFHFTSHDNPDLDPRELQDLENEYRTMGMGYYRQEIMAEYEKPAGTVYEEWDMERRYVPFDYDPNLPVHLSWDFGVNDPTAILFIQPNASEMRIFDYYEASNANLEHFVQYINSKPYKIPSFEAGDIAGRARTLTTGKSVVDELSRLGHHIRTSPIPDIPTQIRHAHQFMNRIYISSSNPNCERVRDCFVNYRYPDVKSTRVDQSNEVPIHDEYSHAMRALEYYCWNTLDPRSAIKQTIPPHSMFGYLQKKQQERWAREELFSY
jgi:hypothetical protein